jgi:hypothetical protein
VNPMNPKIENTDISLASHVSASGSFPLFQSEPSVRFGTTDAPSWLVLIDERNSSRPWQGDVTR